MLSTIRCDLGIDKIGLGMAVASQTLKIAVVGVGKIGSAFAFQLAGQGGHDVTVVARPGSARCRQLQRDGAITDVKGARQPVRVTTLLDERVVYDLVIVTLLAHHVDSLLPALQRSAAKCIQFMFNTFDPERLEALIGVERCAFGMPFIQAMLDSDGRLKATIGAGGQKTIMSQRRWVDLFNGAGLPAAFEPAMPRWLRCHAPVCVAFESISVAGMRRGGGASWGQARVLAQGVRASFDLIKGLGYDVYPKSKRRIAASPLWIVAAALWGISRIRTFRELLATGNVECGELVDAMVAVAAREKPSVAAAIKAMKPS
jgi:2-dehydropantoate 2-reductase